MNQPVSPQSQNAGISLHQQRMFTLIFAAIAFIGMIIPWSVAGQGQFKQTSNGFAEWGILALFGIAGAVVAALLGDKMRELDQNTKYIAIGSFVAVILGSFIQFMKIVNVSGLGVKTGVGVWFTLIGGILGLLWVTGVFKMTIKPSTTSSSPMPPAPPAPPPPPPSPH